MSKQTQISNEQAIEELMADAAAAKARGHAQSDRNKARLLALLLEDVRLHPTKYAKT